MDAGVGRRPESDVGSGRAVLPPRRSSGTGKCNTNDKKLLTCQLSTTSPEANSISRYTSWTLDTRVSPAFRGNAARPSSSSGARNEKLGATRRLTSERKVCADFWAPTCSRYSYTYSANLHTTRATAGRGKRCESVCRG